MTRAADGARVESILSELKSRVSRKLPGWTARGLEDPGWILLEAVAEALAGIREEAERIEERLYPRVLEALGEEPRWAIPARTAVAFTVDEGWEEPVLVPARTVVSAPRRPGEPRVSFETGADAWVTGARLLRVVSSSERATVEIFPHPQMGWDSGPVDLFAGEPSLARHIYIGDPALLLLKDRGGALVLEWTAGSAVLSAGRWEVSAGGGWRAVRVDVEEAAAGEHSRGPASRRAARLRIEGPIPDLTEERIEGTAGPWLRLSLPGRRRLTLQQPVWVSAEVAAAGGDLLAFPRPPRRLFTRAGGRWEDHSLALEKVSPVEPAAEALPAMYLGWDHATPASVYFSLARRAAPESWDGAGGERWPAFQWEHSSRRGFRATDVSDGTHGFTRSGAVAWSQPPEWTPQEHFGERLYWIRARWVSGHYASLPCLEAVVPHALEAVEGRTHANHVLEATVDAAGRAELPLPLAEGEPARFDAIEVRTDAGWERLASVDAPSGEEERGAPAKPARRFSLRRAPRGGWRIDVDPSLAGAAAWRIPALRIGLGARGNVPSSTLSIIEADIAGLHRAAQPLPAGGGRDAETPEAFRARIRAEWKLGDRAVTPRDYERLCRAFDPDIARADVSSVPGESGRVLVTVVPGDPVRPGRITPARLDWLEEKLSERAPLGTLVTVAEAAYVPIQATIRLGDRSMRLASAARLAVEERLEKLLHPVRGGRDGRGFPASRWLRAEDLAARMAEIVAAVLDGPTGGDSRGLVVELAGSDGTALPECPVDASGLASLPLVFPRLERLRFEEEGER